MRLSSQQASRRCREICGLAPVIPVLVIDHENQAAPLAEVLVENGLAVIEVTLRTGAALGAIRRMSEVAGCIVGAGTLISPADVVAARDAGAMFGVSPGATDDLLDACARAGLALLPGAATASEVMKLLAHGYDMVKFFPAEASGGVSALKALAGPLPKVSFCPTGGINPQNVADYLALTNVACVGGSWIAPGELINGGDWKEVAARARSAARLNGR